MSNNHNQQDDIIGYTVLGVTTPAYASQTLASISQAARSHFEGTPLECGLSTEHMTEYLDTFTRRIEPEHPYVEFDDELKDELDYLKGEFDADAIAETVAEGNNILHFDHVLIERLSVFLEKLGKEL